ncbi:MAG: trypsin-like peptidase domain-containing protein [Planctomycetes bacterium]|nr:trypsin-like peptidase domain-containing protein [Planctomycetota bacterium]
MNGERGRPFFDPARGILRIDELVDHDADRWKERGTATALSPTFLVTSAHVLPDGKRTQGLDGWRVCLPGKEQALPVKRFEFHSLDPVDLALIKLKEPVPGMEPCPMVQGHEAVLLDDLRRLPLATTGFPLGLDADKSSGLRIQEGAACGLTTRDGRLREYLLTRGAREGQSGGPLLAFLNGKWVALGIVDLGGRKGMGSGAWSGDEVAALPGLPPALRDSFPALRDLLADDPVLRAWLESEVRRHECMPYLLRRGIQRADLERFFERRLVMREADGLSESVVRV